MGLGLGMLWTPIQAYAFLGTVLTLAALVIYGLISLACWRYFSTTRRTQVERNANRFGLFRQLFVKQIDYLSLMKLKPSVDPSKKRF